MKKLFTLLLFIFSLFCLQGQVLQQKFYFDFGANDITNGNQTVNPDVNGNFWNNISSIPAITPGTVGGGTSIKSGTKFINLKSSTGTESKYGLQFNNAFTVNGIENGGLVTPFASQFVGNEDFAISTATQDYIFNGSGNDLSFKIVGLDLSKQYRFKIFGSRNTTSTRTTQVTIQGAGKANVGTYNTSSDIGLGGNVYYRTLNNAPPNKAYYSISSGGEFSATPAVYFGNNSTVSTSEFVFPDANGEISIAIKSISTAQLFSYINCMKMEEFDLTKISSVSIDGNDIAVNGASSQMTATFLPLGAVPSSPITWSVNDTNLATISTTGLLTPKNNGTVTVTASLAQDGNTITATKEITISNQFTNFYLSGTAISNGGDLGTAILMNEIPDATSPRSIFEITTTLNNTGTFNFYTTNDVSTAIVFGAGSSNSTIAVNGSTIDPIETGLVLIRVNTITGTYKIYPVDPLKISQMGSSVSLGIGATGVQGYSFLYDKILKDRYTNNTGLNWKTSNISVSGNSTINVLNRWENDLLNNGSKYVIYGLSLGNEGILGGGQQKFDQFKTNMLMLISKARSAGKVPVLTGNYGRGDFTTVENDFVKKMNLLIQEWDVPSVNLWGSIDDGNGKWAAGYQNGTDVFHPNDAGHAEMSYAFVPSLFDALQAGKTLPTKQTGYSLTLDKDVLVFKPDNKIHSFTVSFDIKTTSSGIVSTFKQGSSIGSIQIDSATGFLSYTSPSGQKTQGSIVINDGAWHKVTLTHFYVRSKTFLYSDSVSVGSVSEQLNATDFYLNSEISKATALYRDWMFYRSGMNELEITALCNGKMLKSSLELYAPLDGTAATYKEKTRNLAQSTNEISVILSNLGVKDSNKFDSKNIMLIPTVISKELRIFGLSTSNSETYQFKIYSIDGKQVYKKEQYNYNESVDVSNLKSGTYLLNLKNSKSSESITLYFIKK